MTLTLISGLLVALGVLVLIMGLVLVVVRQRVAGAVVALLGASLIICPMLVYLYVVLTMNQ